MDREKFLRIQRKLQKYGTLLRYFSFIILTFLFLQIEAFSVDVYSETLMPKIQFFAGILQIIMFLVFLLMEEGTPSNLLITLKKHIFDDVKSTFKMALPPLLLLLSTQLMGIGNEIIPGEAKKASSFYIVGVAICSLLVLKKKFLMTQILAIIFIAVGLTNFPNESQISTTTISISNLFSDQELYACISILAAICCYGLSYTILEHNLKSSEVSLWIRGIQLNLFIVPLSFLLSFGNYYMSESPRGFFDNFNIIAWFFIIFLVACNMMELFVIKVADCMFRMIASSIAVMIIGIMQYPFRLDTFSATKLGTGLILAGTALYTVIDLIQPNMSAMGEEEDEIRNSQPYVVPMKLYQSVPTVSYKVKNHDNDIQNNSNNES